MKQNSLIIAFWQASVCALTVTAIGFGLISCSPPAPSSSTSMGDLRPADATTVAVVKVGRKDLSKSVDITAEFLPWQSVEIHAQVTGYVKQINVDVGDHAKTGEVIAVLQIPELQDELKQADAEVRMATESVAAAQADYDESNLLANRLDGAAKETEGLIAQQDIDNADAKNRSAQANLAASKQKVAEAQANADHLRDLVAYSNIIAPFDGIVTRRYADTGALIQAGSAGGSSSIPLVSFEQLNRLRLEFPVPESDVADVHVGDPVEINVPSLSKTFTGQVSRFAHRVDTATRTMLTEVDVPNPDENYTPGMYATVSLTLAIQKDVLVVPIQSLSTGDQPFVFVVADHKIEKRNVKVGIKTPDSAQILNGLNEGDLIVVGNQAALQPGQEVNLKLVGIQSP